MPGFISKPSLFRPRIARPSARRRVTRPGRHGDDPNREFDPRRLGRLPTLGRAVFLAILIRDVPAIAHSVEPEPKPEPMAGFVHCLLGQVSAVEMLDPDPEEKWFGRSAAFAGDVDGDGFTDVIIGSSRYTGDTLEEGRVVVYHGSQSGNAPRPGRILLGGQRYSDFGYSVDGAGDVNGDGFADVIVGAKAFDGHDDDVGAAFVFHGSAAGLEAEPAWKAFGEHRNSHFGRVVTAAGDVNGDGYSDILVAAPRFGRNGVRTGRVYGYHGSADGLNSVPDWIVDGDQDGAGFAETLAWAGDVDADGYDDLLIGAHMVPAGKGGLGRVCVVQGPALAAPGSVARRMGGQMLPLARRLEPPAPPFWRSPGAYAALLVGLPLVAVLAVQLNAARKVRRKLRKVEQQSALEQERLRISRDLHDHLGAGLTRISLLNELVRQGLNTDHPAATAIRKIDRTTLHLIRAVDELVWAVNPGKDNPDDLTAYLCNYAAEFLNPTHIRCRFDLPAELPAVVVPSEIRHALFLVVREALNNVVKHASATEVRLRIRMDRRRDHNREPDCVFLSVVLEDDGQGYAPDTVRKAASGIENMKQRAESAGGRCSIVTAPGRGTSVRVELDLPLSASTAS